jgi:hypothetical protein
VLALALNGPLVETKTVHSNLEARERDMTKIQIALAAVGAVVLVPSAALAVHTMSCCGDFWCCLMHLGCC